MDFFDIWKKAGIEKELIQVSVGNFSAILLGAVLWFVLAYLLESEQYGEINFDVAVATLASTVATLGLNFIVMTFLPKNQKNVLREANTIIVITNIPVFVFLFFITESLPVALLMVFTTTFMMSAAEYLGNHQYRKYVTLLISQKILQITLGLGLFFLLDINGILIGYAISYLVTSFNFFKTIRKFTTMFTVIRSKKHQVLHTYSLEVARTINMYSDKIVIAPIFGFAILGLYQFAAHFLLFLGIIPAILYNYLLPSLTKHSKYKKIYTLSIGLSTLGAFAVFFISPIVIENIFLRYQTPRIFSLIFN